MSAKPDRHVERFFAGREFVGEKETTRFLREHFGHAVTVRVVRELAIEFDADVIDEKIVVIDRAIFYDVLAELDVQAEGLEGDDDE